MKTSNLNSLISGLSLLAAALISNSTAKGELIYGLTFRNSIITFDSSSPGTLINTLSISGLNGASLLGLDLRPANGQLLGVGSNRQIYTIDPLTGSASQIGATPFAENLGGTRFGVDVNPVPDRVRLVSDADTNLRLNPNDGSLTATDGILAYAVGDAHFGLDPRVVGAAYANNVAGATTTTLYAIDSQQDILARQSPPNDGVLNTIGLLGFNTTDQVAFDISGVSGVAYASLTAPNATTSELFEIDLTTGAATSLGSVGGESILIGLAAPIPEPSTVAMIALGLIGIIASRRKRANT